ncbi:hypothetical protein DQ04_00771020 [Trypanosoma grayi]|uniref:hypothetical protein n=1 Tax=Trypanosoma grayi TaxID=71804 RepID=UPI0004F430EC|nr:hypothetical protein DQ04_00771020 [Trypanosoma grayi]KEG13804.1 hypothetical protein DQ04_00771020 [Trypanosoma grayi]
MLRALWSVPMVTLGEFDSLEGPKAICVSEYYAYQEIDAFGPQLLELSALHGKILFSARVASGPLCSDYKERMKAVVARVLASNESTEESVIMLDPIAGGIASVSFCLSDILARGEKRRFCVIVTHPQSDELVRQWPVLSCFLKKLLEDWVATAKKRLTFEYSTFPDLERRREEARKCPMRSLMTLLARNMESEDSVFRRVHVFFECALPRVFGGEPLRLSGCISETLMMNLVRQHLEKELHLVSIVDVDLECHHEEGRYISVGNGKLLTAGRPPIVKPLSVWLLQFVQNSATGLQETERLLLALFSGNQILIYGEDSLHCANLALSLSQVLPRPLRRVTIFAEEYVMPYESRIVSFNQRLCERYQVDNAHILEDEFLESDIVCVNTSCRGCILSVNKCDELSHPRAVAKNNRSSKIKNTLPPQIVSRITDLFRSQRSANVTVHTCKVLQFRLEQLVNEYVMRGRVYSRLFQEHELKCNQRVLGLAKSDVSGQSRFGGLGSAVRNLFTGYVLQTENRDSASSSTTEYGCITKGNTASFLKLLKESGLDLWVTSSTDHDALLFLGSASCML